MAGIIDTVQLAGALVLAIPAALAGLLLLESGEHVAGTVLLFLAAGLVVAQRWVTLPSDVPGLVAKRALGAVPKEPDEDGDEDGER